MNPRRARHDPDIVDRFRSGSPLAPDYRSALEYLPMEGDQRADRIRLAGGRVSASGTLEELLSESSLTREPWTAGEGDRSRYSRYVLIEGRPLWLAQTNTWVFARERGSEAVVIDAPPDPDGVAELLAVHDLTPVALLVTHGHVDHVGGAGAIARRLAVTAYVHPDDDFLTLDPSSQLRMLFGMVPPGDFAPPDAFAAIADGTRLDLAGFAIDVVHTPGHTPGHCCYLIEDEGVLFSGDQLFAGSIGRTDLPGGDTDRLMESMRAKVMPLPDDVRVLPGHGPETTIGTERSSNPFRAYWQ